MDIDATLVWFLVGLVLALLEFAVPGVLLIFFAFGAWITAGTTYLGWTESIMWQLLVFSGASILLLASLRDWMHGQLYGHVGHVQDPAQNLDEFKGKRVTVLKDISPGRSEAAVELKGAVWTVESDQTFKTGEIALVTGVEGIALKITNTPETSNG